MVRSVCLKWQSMAYRSSQFTEASQPTGQQVYALQLQVEGVNICMCDVSFSMRGRPDVGP